MTGANTQQIGFVGLGDRGGPMATAIAEAGFTLPAWARRPQSYAVLSQIRFTRRDDFASLAGSVDMIALCLTMTNLNNASDVFNVAGDLGIDLHLLQDVIAVSSGSSAILRPSASRLMRRRRPTSNPSCARTSSISRTPFATGESTLRNFVSAALRERTPSSIWRPG